MRRDVSVSLGLMAGAYYLSVGTREGELELGGEKEKHKSGFPP